MVNSIIKTNSSFLQNEGGHLLPDKATLSICGIEDGDYKEEKIKWWDRVWGFDMSSIKKLTMLEPLVDTVEARNVVTDHCTFLVCNKLYLFRKKKQILIFVFLFYRMLI